MKIIPPGITRNPDVSNLYDAKKKRAESGDAPKEGGKAVDRDKMTIGADSSPVLSDAQLIASLKKSIMADIQAGASQQKIANLKQQVALNEYDINPADIARRMLLDNEANYD